MTRHFRLPWPPSVNGAWGHRNSRKYHTARGREFRAESIEDIYRQLGSPLPVFAGRLRVLLELAPPDRTKRDIDNHAKAVLDAIEASGLIKDDEQIDELIIKRLPIDKPGCCDVTIADAAERAARHHEGGKVDG